MANIDDMVDRLIADMIEHGWVEFHGDGEDRRYRPANRPPEDWPVHRDFWDFLKAEYVRRQEAGLEEEWPQS